MSREVMQQATFDGDDGYPRPERRARDRAGDDERIDHLFNGFDNLIATAELNRDSYGAGYLGAMRKEFGELIRDMLAAPQPAPVAQQDERVEELANAIAEQLADTYICGRVWSAWQVGTMGEDDFTPADESDLPLDIARAVLALHANKIGGAA